MTVRLSEIWKNKKKVIAVFLALLILLSASTYAWFTSRGVISGGNFGLERIKIRVDGLNEYREAYALNPDGTVDKSTMAYQWMPIRYDEQHPKKVELYDLYKGQQARELLQGITAAPSDPDADDYAFSDGTKWSYNNLLEFSTKGQYMFSVENLGDHAYVYVNIAETIGVELATNAFQIPPGAQADLVDYKPGYFEDGISTTGITGVYPDGVPGYPTVLRSHIWFADVAEELNERLNPALGDYDNNFDIINGSDSRYVISFSDLTGIMATVEGELNTAVGAFNASSESAYAKALREYLEAVSASKKDPKDETLAIAVSTKWGVWQTALDEAKYNHGDPQKLQLDKLIKEYNDYVILWDAMQKAGAAAKDETGAAVGAANIVIRNSWLNVATFKAGGSSSGTNVDTMRPLTLPEIDTLLTAAGGSYSTGTVIDDFINTNGNDAYTGMVNASWSSRNIKITPEIQYGDVATQIASTGKDLSGNTVGVGMGTAVNQLLKAAITKDGTAIWMDMEHGAKVNILFTVNVPVRNYTGSTFIKSPTVTSTSLIVTGDGVVHEDNLFNSALLSLGVASTSRTSAVATNPNDAALKDITGVIWDDTNSEYYEGTGANKKVFDYLDLETDVLPAQE